MAFSLTRRAFVVGLTAALTAASVGLDTLPAEADEASDEATEPRGYADIVGVL